MNIPLRAIVRTALGSFELSFTEKGLASLTFPHNSQSKTIESLPLVDDSGIQDTWLSEASGFLKEYLAGEEVAPPPIPFDLSRGSDFQQRVWNALIHIPRGQTLSYGEIAGRLGSPGASRAVGSACGKNPLPIFVPCHRVLASKGAIGGFSLGLEWKRKLLALENHTPALWNSHG